MFDVDAKEPSKPKLPTLRQFLKELSNEEPFPIYLTVECIWFPGKWDNYTIVTNRARVVIANTHPLYKPVDKGIVAFTDEGIGLLVCCKDNEGTICLSKSAVYGTWERIGNAGIRFAPAEG